MPAAQLHRLHEKEDYIHSRFKATPGYTVKNSKQAQQSEPARRTPPRCKSTRPSRARSAAQQDSQRTTGRHSPRPSPLPRGQQLCPFPPHSLGPSRAHLSMGLPTWYKAVSGIPQGDAVTMKILLSCTVDFEVDMHFPVLEETRLERREAPQLTWLLSKLGQSRTYTAQLPSQAPRK